MFSVLMKPLRITIPGFEAQVQSLQEEYKPTDDYERFITPDLYNAVLTHGDDSFDCKDVSEKLPKLKYTICVADID